MQTSLAVSRVPKPDSVAFGMQVDEKKDDFLTLYGTPGHGRGSPLNLARRAYAEDAASGEKASEQVCIINFCWSMQEPKHCLVLLISSLAAEYT